MDARRRVKLSKTLARYLRHRPDAVGIALDAGGWADVDALLDALARRGVRISRAELRQVVAEGDKPRFELSGDATRVRARYGHSVAVDLRHAAADPPSVLYHGTAAAAVDAILARGLAPMGRRHVHLSEDIATARRVGARHGRPAVLAVDAAAMVAGGATFLRAADGVWLTDAVSPDRLLGVVDDP
ncbi:MAG: RNA 2'-phosphotransferase [Actinomycetota bacterium]|nr:RNA 2'-phosphotransferase [Actinomycetota bacterium]